MLLLAFFLTVLASLQAGEATVCAVLFYSPSCPHCHTVINDHLLPLREKYGERLAIMAINTQIPEGQRLFHTVMEHFRIPRDEWGVPALVIGNTLLKGGLEIPRDLPDMIEEGLALGGIGWPGLAGLKDVINTMERASGTEAREPINRTAEAVVSIDNNLSGEMTLAQKYARDPFGNGLALAVLAGMVLSLIAVFRRLSNTSAEAAEWPRWSIFALACIGLGVAGYLSFVEVNQVAAVCGPVGDCNSVQQSPYARLFGIFPVALLGLSGYVAILVAWLVRHYGPVRLREVSALALWALALTGTLFSIYFTFLEPFVIGATCLWCLTSAVAMTLLLWASTTPVKSAWQALRSPIGGAEQ